MTEAVVDRLEVVHVEEEQGEVEAGSARALERVHHAVGQQRTIREARQRIVERLVRELVLELAAVADVVRGEDEPAHGRVVEEVAHHALDGAPGAVFVSEPELQLHPSFLPHLFAQAPRDLVELRGVQELVEARADHRCRLVPEQGLHGRGDVPDQEVGLEHRDQVVRVLDERAEARLAAALEEVVGQLGALERECNLRRQRRQPLVQMPTQWPPTGDAHDTLEPVTDCDRHDQGPCRAEPAQRSRAPDLAAQSLGRPLRSRRRRRPSRPVGARVARSSCAYASRSPPASSNAVAAPMRWISSRVAAATSAAAPDWRTVSRCTKRSFATTRPASLATTSTSNGTESAAMPSGKPLRRAERLEEHDRDRRQHGRGEESEPPSREEWLRPVDPLRQRAHVREQRHAAPEQVRRDGGEREGAAGNHPAVQDPGQVDAADGHLDRRRRREEDGRSGPHPVRQE